MVITPRYKMNTLSISSYRGPSVHIPSPKLSTVYLAVRVATLQEKTKKVSEKEREWSELHLPGIGSANFEHFWARWKNDQPSTTTMLVSVHKTQVTLIKLFMKVEF